MLTCKLLAWRPLPNGRKMVAKTTFHELFVTKTMHHFIHFLAADFREI